MTTVFAFCIVWGAYALFSLTHDRQHSGGLTRGAAALLRRVWPR